MAKFKVGDVVCLPSGGPHLTVVAASADQSDTVSCDWFTSTLPSGKPKNGSFPESVLSLVKNAGPKPAVNVGDSVQLLSGSPTMTVFAAGTQCECRWFDDQAEIRKETFTREALTRVSG